MKKIAIILLLFSCISNIHGQRSTYKGNYVLDDRSGTVEYEYIEINNERVLDGYFTFTYHNGFGSLSGYFKNGLKDGPWVFANGSGVYARKNFKNGKLDGLCESGDLKLNLKDNHFVGSFSYTNNRTTYTGQFNQNGYADGEWVIDSYRSGIRHIRTLKWENGTLASDIEFDESTGKKIDHLDPKNFGSPQAYIAYQEEISNYFDRKVKSHPVYEYYEAKSKHSNLPKRGIYMGEYPMIVAPFNGRMKLPMTEEQKKVAEEKKQNDLKKDAESAVGKYMVEAIELYQKRNYSEAIEVCKKAIEENPNNADAYRVMGDSYYMMKSYPNVIKSFKKSIELDPTKIEWNTFWCLGIAYYKEGDFSNAIEPFQKAIDLNVDAPGSTYNYLGASYYKSLLFSEAINAFQKAIELGESAKLNYYNIGKSYSRLGNNAEAVKSYQKAADLGNEQAKKALMELNNEN